MKRLFIIICLTTALWLGGCNSLDNQGANLPNLVPPIVEELPEIENGSNDGESNESFDQEEEEKKKKRYAVSSVNSLRIRSGASTNSTVVGYLDKNDAVQILDTLGNYYVTVYKEKTAYVSKTYCTVMEVDLASEDIERAIDQGAMLLGHPYVWGAQRYHWGNGKLNANFVAGEFDCSALVQYVYYHSNDVILDVTSRAQAYNGKHVDKSQLQRGDLMFFTNSSRYNLTGNERIGHVGIYFGNNYILHTASDHAVIEPISNLRWSYYVTARRVV